VTVQLWPQPFGESLISGNRLSQVSMPRIGHILVEQFLTWLKAVEDNLETSIVNSGVATPKDRDIQLVEHRSYSSNENNL
jgi:hypothetical protein